ncbi:TPA: tRNA threonylcarbamoyladenosine dehydratase [Candidatus Gastranaerophilales bacterium HUM_9]|nr:MAG TPA: tRNA threonylcarbamoyladenosine dehydratase [Candidatus Gastranaerophilales bacterium HUM_9]HBX35616.1 tRNA threonylcarbamoyladenosine dehydratase [Cyanobacteria bacterium UBA11440]
MLNQFSRTQLMFGKENIEKLHNSHVAIFGIGGVGGYTVEALVRSGVGKITLVDDDKVCLTNLNRQLYATLSTVGKYKVDVAEERILDIYKKAEVTKFKTFYTPETKDMFDFSQYDYVVDAIDTVIGKLSIVEECYKSNTPVISSMGAGNKVNPTMFEVDDIYNTSVCPLARVMRQELRKRKIPKLKVVYSKEKALKPLEDMAISCKTHCICPPGTVHKCTNRRNIPSSNAFVPSVVGLIIAGEVIKDIIDYK